MDDKDKKLMSVEISKLKSGYVDTTINGKKENVFVQHYLIEGLEWNITCVATLDDIKMTNKNLTNSFIIIALLSILLVSIGVHIVAKMFLKPIEGLKNTMDKIDSSSEKIRADESGPIEVSELSKHFNNMLDRIDVLMSDIQVKEKDIREYELKALASQINPHFLYNTLDTIVWMAEFNDSESVVEITSSLAKYFRLSLNQGNEIISLHDELDHVQQYLFIQKKRYGKKLNYEINNEFTCKEFKIPKLVLQPIVENAIYHGIKELDRDGKITIDVKCLEESIKVIIYDNGRGFDKNKQEKGESKRLGGVGLKNIDRRLSLYFGDGYDMNIDSKLGEYTKVTLTLPKKQNI